MELTRPAGLIWVGVLARLGCYCGGNVIFRSDPEPQPARSPLDLNPRNTDIAQLLVV